MAKPFALALYHSAAWRRARADAMARSHGLCQRCLERGMITPAEIVHHVRELTARSVDDPSIATDPANLVCLCRECHAVVHGFAASSTRPGLSFDIDGNLMQTAPAFSAPADPQARRTGSARRSPHQEFHAPRPRDRRGKLKNHARCISGEGWSCDVGEKGQK